jgi:hypothetical protein
MSDIDEFTFRFNRRTSASRGKLFYRLVQQAVTTDPVLGRNIIGGKSADIASCQTGDNDEIKDAHFLKPQYIVCRGVKCIPLLIFYTILLLKIHVIKCGITLFFILVIELVQLYL